MSANVGTARKTVSTMLMLSKSSRQSVAETRRMLVITLRTLTFVAARR